MNPDSRVDFDDDLAKGVDYFVLLGVSEDPSYSELMLAYHRKLKGITQDAAFTGPEIAEDQKQRYLHAFDVLQNDRARYMQALRRKRVLDPGADL